MISSCTELIVGASKAKVCGELFGEIPFYVAARKKPGRNGEKRVFESETLANNIFEHRKIKVWELSERRFGELSSQSEPSSRGERLFKVCKSEMRRSRWQVPTLGACKINETTFIMCFHFLCKVLVHASACLLF